MPSVDKQQKLPRSEPSQGSPCHGGHVTVTRVGPLELTTLLLMLCLQRCDASRSRDELAVIPGLASDLLCDRGQIISSPVRI